MKKLLLATVMALGIADAAYASQYVTPWFGGQYFCNVENSKDRFGIKFSFKYQEKARTCKGDRCSTNGYELKNFASIRMTGWNQAHSGEFVVDHGSYVTFYFIDNKHFVRLNKPVRAGTHRFPARGTYSQDGKTWNITCRKA